MWVTAIVRSHGSSVGLAREPQGVCCSQLQGAWSLFPSGRGLRAESATRFGCVGGAGAGGVVPVPEAPRGRASQAWPGECGLPFSSGGRSAVQSLWKQGRPDSLRRACTDPSPLSAGHRQRAQSANLKATTSVAVVWLSPDKFASASSVCCAGSGDCGPPWGCEFQRATVRRKPFAKTVSHTSQRCW